MNAERLTAALEELSDRPGDPWYAVDPSVATVIDAASAIALPILERDAGLIDHIAATLEYNAPELSAWKWDQLWTLASLIAENVSDSLCDALRDAMPPEDTK